MKKITPTLTILVVLVAGIFLSERLQSQTTPGAMSSGTTKIFSGELTRVEAAGKKLYVKSSEGNEMEFQYNDQTKITGSEGSVEGLATMSGSSVRIHYEDGTKLASLIEVEQKKTE